MNSVANGKIREQTRFREVYIQPAAGDNGTALGAAFYAWHQIAGRPRGFVMEHGYWGPEFDDAQIAAALDGARTRRSRAPAARRRVVGRRGALDDWTAAQIADGRVVGWYQGRMEWGARALGNRSIVADPRRADMRDIINTRIKFRERFRPFAPSVLEEARRRIFRRRGARSVHAAGVPGPPGQARRSCRPITHVDGSGRLQTVSATANPRYWQLINAFGSSPACRCC